MTEPLTVAEWARNTRETVRVSLSTFNGQAVVDIRVCFRDSDGAMKPGRAGLTLGAKHLPALAMRWRWLDGG